MSTETLWKDIGFDAFCTKELAPSCPPAQMMSILDYATKVSGITDLPERIEAIHDFHIPLKGSLEFIHR